MPPEPDAPGPGQYDLVDYDGSEKQFASSSMFISTSNRWIPRKDGAAPGPGMSFEVLLTNYSRLGKFPAQPCSAI